MKNNRRKVCSLLMILLFCALAGCSAPGERAGSQGIVTGRYYNPNAKEDSESLEAIEDTQEEEEASKDQPGTDLFLIISNDMKAQKLVLKQIASGKQYMYNYSTATCFLNKYGDRTTASEFASGRCMTVRQKDVQGKLLETKLSDTVWEYPDVTRYTVDEERGILKIADMKYAFDESLFVNSDGEEMELSDLTDLDTIRIVGIGKKLLSVSVTTGHGKLALKNTDLFEGSFIQIGSKIFSEITKDMTLEIPEGDYTVTVANNGYGGSTDVTIERNKTRELDLDQLKGEGPKFGKILFAVNVADAVLIIDGEVVDYSEPISLQYGVHKLIVLSEGYETYNKKLFVNSPEATIIIGLDDGSITPSEGTTQKSDSTAKGGMSGSKAGSLAGSKAGGSTSSGSGSSSSGVNADKVKETVTDAALKALLGGDSDSGSSSSDYLSTLTEVLEILTDKEKKEKE